jgi:cobalt transporter subunit CbtB
MSLGNREDGARELRESRESGDLPPSRTVQAVHDILEHARRVLPLMTTSSISTRALALDRQTLAGVVCLFLGLFLVAGVGFAGPAAIHNAAHDTRHATGFPCH